MSRLHPGELISDGDLVEAMPPRVLEQRFWTSNLGFEVVAELRKVSGHGVPGSSLLGQKDLIYQRGARGGPLGAGAAPDRGHGSTSGWDPPLLLGWPLHEPSWLRG